jgi:hypothetical protein
MTLTFETNYAIRPPIPNGRDPTYFLLAAWRNPRFMRVVGYSLETAPTTKCPATGSSIVRRIVPALRAVGA